MTEDRRADTSELQRQLDLLQELQELVRRQERSRQAAETETRRLRCVIEDAVTRLSTMLSGERASRAALQAVVEDLRTAVAQDDTSATLHRSAVWAPPGCGCPRPYTRPHAAGQARGESDVRTSDEAAGASGPPG